MDELVNSYMESNQSKSAYTRQSFITTLKRISKVLGKPIEEFQASDFSDPEELSHKLLNEYALATTILTMVGTKFLMKQFKNPPSELEAINEIIRQLSDERAKIQNSQEFTEKEEKYWMPFEEIERKVIDKSEDFLKKKQAFTQMRNFLMVALFSLQPPTRIGNYLDMHYREGSALKRGGTSLRKDRNYVIHDGDGKYTFIFNKYKTAKSVGQVKHQVQSDLLNALIHKWFTDYNTAKKLFLVTFEGNSMTQVGATGALLNGSKKFLGKPLTLNSYRHIFLTDYLKTNPTIEEKQDVLTLIGHKYRPATHEKYVRVNKKE